jgi:hypothetical protein
MPVIIELMDPQNTPLFIEDILKLLSIFLSWPAIFLFVILYYRCQIREVIPLIPVLVKRLKVFSLFNDLIRTEFNEDEVKEDAKKNVIDSPAVRFSEEERLIAKALIKSLETGNCDQRAYAFEALKDVSVSLPGSEHDRVGEQEINQLSLGAYLRRVFPDRDHSEPKYVSEIVDELLKENCKYIKNVESLIKKYPLETYVLPLDAESGVISTDVGIIRSLLVAKKIDEINDVIKNWRPLPPEPENLQDREPFVNIGSKIASYIMKSGDNIKIQTTNVGDLEITNDELGNRIGTGLPYLRRLMERLEPFHTYLLSEAAAHGHGVGD